MKEPILVIMAAGMGSRYGGLKQMDPVGPGGELILDYSLYDAMRAGFKRAVIVIKPENEADFREVLGDRVARHMRIEYAHQVLGNLPDGYAVPEGRVKPWGTGHATLSAARLIDAPFCVINADDYYGAQAFRLCYEHLTSASDDGDYMMAGYLVKNTLSETGYVSRGVCSLDKNGFLTDIVEQLHIIGTVDGPMLTGDGVHYTRIDEDTVVSMNMWAFPEAFKDSLTDCFKTFLDGELPQNPIKKEFFLPYAVDLMIRSGKARVAVRITPDKWYGVTYREDKPEIQAALLRMTREGLYPERLWAK